MDGAVAERRRPRRRSRRLLLPLRHVVHYAEPRLLDSDRRLRVLDVGQQDLARNQGCGSVLSGDSSHS